MSARRASVAIVVGPTPFRIPELVQAAPSRAVTNTDGLWLAVGMGTIAG